MHRKITITLAVLVGLVIVLLSGCGSGSSSPSPTPSPITQASRIELPDGFGGLATVCDNGHRLYIHSDEIKVIEEDSNCARLSAEKALKDAQRIK